MEQNQLTTEQIARVFAMHIGCRVQHKKFVGTYFTLSGCYQQCVFIDNAGRQTLQPIPFDYAKLMLKPISSIIFEDAIEVAKMCHAYYDPAERYKIRYRKGDSICSPSVFAQLYFEYYDEGERGMREQIVANFSDTREMVNPCSGVSYFSSMSEAFQYLISKGYAVPLFIAPGHPLNGKTAIEIGLAIDSTQSANTPSV